MRITKRAAAVVTAASMAMALAVPGAALAHGGEGRGIEASEARGDNGKQHRAAQADERGDNRTAAARGDGEAKAAPQSRAKPDNKPDQATSTQAQSTEARPTAQPTPAAQARGDADARPSGGVTHRPPHTDEEIYALEGNDDRGPWNRRVTLCHATSSETNPYVMITVSHRAVVKGGHGNHDDDIIPPFAYLPHRGGDVEHYLGLNWNDETAAIFDAGCIVGADDVDGFLTMQGALGAIGVDTAAETEADAEISPRVLGVSIDADEAGEEEIGVGVLGVSGERFGVGGGNEADDQAVAATIAAASADADGDTEVQAAQSSNFAGGVLAQTGLPLAVLLIAGLLSLLAGTGLLRRRS